MNTKDAARIAVRFASMPGRYTVLEMAEAVQLSAHLVREVFGLLYGRGEIRVGELAEGSEPVWIRTTQQERGRL